MIFFSAEAFLPRLAAAADIVFYISVFFQDSSLDFLPKYLCANVAVMHIYVFYRSLFEEKTLAKPSVQWH